MQGHAGLHRAVKEVFDPGPLQSGSCLHGKDLGPAPFAACHCQQRPFTQRPREGLVPTDLLPGADRIRQRRVATIEVTGKDAREPLHQHR